MAEANESGVLSLKFNTVEIDGNWLKLIEIDRDLPDSEFTELEESKGKGMRLITPNSRNP